MTDYNHYEATIEMNPPSEETLEALQDQLAIFLPGGALEVVGKFVYLTHPLGPARYQDVSGAVHSAVDATGLRPNYYFAREQLVGPNT